MELRYKDKVLGASGGSGIPTGAVMSWLGTIAPDGWVICDGAVYQIEDHQTLASVIEQQFGNKNHFGGDGENTFAVPDMRGRFVLGASESHAFGETGGEEKVELTEDNIPKHQHEFYGEGGTGSIVGNVSMSINASKATSGNVTGGSGTIKTSFVGKSSGNDKLPHNNLPPYLTLSYIIKT